jgi:hypothetical protein
VACVSATEGAGSGKAAQAPGAASQFARGHRPKRRLDTEQEAEDCLPRPAKAGDSPRASGNAEGARPEWREAATQASAVTPTARPGDTATSEGSAAKPKKKKAKTKAAQVPAGEAAGRDKKGVRPAAEGEGVSADRQRTSTNTSTQKEEGAVSGVRMLPEACPGQQLGVSGHDTEAEAGHGPPEAAVSVLPEAPDGHGVLDSEQVAQLHSRGMWQAASRDAA